MVPVQVIALKHDVRNDCKHSQRDAFLNNLQLHQRERAAIFDESEAIGRHLTAIFKEGDAPRESNHAYQRPVVTDARLL